MMTNPIGKFVYVKIGKHKGKYGEVKFKRLSKDLYGVKLTERDVRIMNEYDEYGRIVGKRHTIGRFL